MRFAPNTPEPEPRYVPAGRDVVSDVVPPPAPVLIARTNAVPDASPPSLSPGHPIRRLVALPVDSPGHAATPTEHAARSRATTAVPWNELMRTHGRRIIVSLVARGIPMERARELSQEAWLRIIAQHRAGRLDRLEMPGIVVAQANFLAHDEHRRRGRRARMGLTSAAEPGAEVAELADAITGPDLERRVSARQALRRVLGVVDRSYPSAQRVFHLLYGADPKTPTQVSEETGLSVQRVRQILCELRRTIRTELGPDVSGGPTHE